MKAEELRIGNFIQDGLDTFTVSGIMENSVCLKEFPIVHESLRIGKVVNSLLLSHFEPIPLTDEWAVKFGYENLGEMALAFSEDGIVSVEFQGSDFKGMFVHQAQNLYYALTGEELKTR